MTQRPCRSIEQLDFERRWLMAKATHSAVGEAAQNDLARQIEDLELAIAATPVADIVDLNIKANRLAEVLHPSSGPILEDSMEGVLLNAVLVGCRHLADHGNDE